MAEDIVTALDAATKAFERPSLALLHRQHAPGVIAALREVFGPDPAPVPVDRMHATLESHHKRLAEAGRADAFPAGKTGRDWCRGWVGNGWLRRDTPTGSDTDVYVLTSAAREAIAYVERATELRTASLSESRIRTILETARRAALDATPDARTRIAALEDKIAELARERDRLTAGGVVEPVSADRMLEAFLNIADLLSNLPADFQRVAEAESRGRGELIKAFRLDDRGAGSVLTEYLDTSERLLTSTPEGRAFLGAVELLQSEEAMEALRADLHRILEHGFAAALTSAEQRDFRTAVDRIDTALAVVQQERYRTSSSIRRFVRERSEIDRVAITEALDRALVAAEQWLLAAAPRDQLPSGVAPGPGEWVERLAIGNQWTRTHRFGDETSPQPLHRDPAGQQATGLTAEELLAIGGPHLRNLQRAVQRLLDSDPAAPSWTLADIFAAADHDDRRLVDFIGLVGMSAAADALPARVVGPRQTITVRQPDGTTLDYTVPLLTIDRAAARQMAALSPTITGEFR